MKAIILAGGLGSRLMEITEIIPKPMLRVGDKPLLGHIIEIYEQFGVDEIFIAGGYRQEVIEDYLHQEFKSHVHLIDTGLGAMTGSRLAQMYKFVDPVEPFFMTYGDGLCDVDLDKVLAFHMKQKSIATITAVRPAGRFGRVLMDGAGVVTQFGEKVEGTTDWINGGFMVLDHDIFKYLASIDPLINFEKDILPRLVMESKMFAFRHSGFWACVDTKRDLLELEETYQTKGKVWLKKTGS